MFEFVGSKLKVKCTVPEHVILCELSRVTGFDVVKLIGLLATLAIEDRCRDRGAIEPDDRGFIDTAPLAVRLVELNRAWK